MRERERQRMDIGSWNKRACQNIYTTYTHIHIPCTKICYTEPLRRSNSVYKSVCGWCWHVSGAMGTTTASSKIAACCYIFASVLFIHHNGGRRNKNAREAGANAGWFAYNSSIHIRWCTKLISVDVVCI